MPLTPFHLGPALLLGLFFLNYIDLPTFLIANVIVDLEPLFIILFNLNLTHHQFLHSFLGGTIVALFLSGAMYKIRGILSPLLSFFKLQQNPTFWSILITSITGIYTHILLDSTVHRDIRPLYPLDVNPFLNSDLLSVLSVYMFCILSLIGGIIFYALRLLLISRKTMK
jgi:membrane-bound metal-dependent hydrolase YbcI (DUF457 family)